MNSAPETDPAELEELEARPGSLDVASLAALPTLELRARALVESYLSGRHRSPIKGTAPEFAEYRAYQPGDDLRRVDWRLYARSDRLSLKQYEDENQLRVCLALDLSGSLRYASRPRLPSKFDYARMALAAIALIVRRQRDALGLALVGDGPGAPDGLLEFLRPGAGRADHQTVFSRLESPPTARTAPLAAALGRLPPVMPHGSLVVVASDFYVELPELDAALRLLRSRRIELLGFQVLDPFELDFDRRVAAQFVDLETGERIRLHSPACRAGYLERFGAYRRELAEVFRRHQSDLVLLRTDSSPLTALSSYLARRGRRFG